MPAPAILNPSIPFDLPPAVKLSTTEITQNYYAGYQLALEIIQERLGDRAFGEDATDLAQSVFGCERLVRLIESKQFEKEVYTRVITDELNRVSRELFPDVGKRHIVSLDKLHDEYLLEFEEKSSSPQDPTISQFELLDYVKGKISSDRFSYLEKLVKNQTGTDRECSWTAKLYHVVDHSVEYLEQKIDHLQKLYPDGVVLQEDPVDATAEMTDDQITDCYKNLLLGITRRLPMHFLSHHAPRRTALLTRFAIEQVLEIDALTALRELNPVDFAGIGLRGVVRYYNYSLNRMIRNAYPDLLMPWESGHVESGFWDEADNRKMAIRWLIEEKLGIPRDQLAQSLRSKRISKSTFVDHGLSYMFVTHFKSVSRCVGFAYPELMPWELGSVPNSFWQNGEGRQNIIRAVRWMIGKLGIPVEEIPERVRDKTISRETFARFGLATVFERVFKKNMYHIISTAYPGRFEVWEIGRVPSGYWDNLMNGYRAAKWVARQHKIDDANIDEALRTRKITKAHFEKLGLGPLLKSVFENDLRKAYLPHLIPVKTDRDLFLRDVFMLYILQKQIRDLQHPTPMQRFLRGIFIKPLAKSVDQQQLRIYERIRRRVKQRIGEVTTRVMHSR